MQLPHQDDDDISSTPPPFTPLPSPPPSPPPVAFRGQVLVAEPLQAPPQPGIQQPGCAGVVWWLL